MISITFMFLIRLMINNVLSFFSIFLILSNPYTIQFVYESTNSCSVCQISIYTIKSMASFTFFFASFNLSSDTHWSACPSQVLMTQPRVSMRPWGCRTCEVCTEEGGVTKIHQRKEDYVDLTLTRGRGSKIPKIQQMSYVHGPYVVQGRGGCQ